MWFILDTEEDRSLCLVHFKNILRAGSEINVNDRVTFFYNGTEYRGIVLAKSMDHDKLTRDLSAMKKQLTGTLSTNADANQKQETSKKRRIQPTKFYGEPVVETRKKSEQPKMSQEEKTKKRILESNKKEAARLANAQLLSQISTKKKKSDGDDDDDWMCEEDSGTSDDDTSSDISNFVSHNIKRKEERNNLVKEIKVNANRQSPSHTKSPTKEDLKKEVENLKIKLQVIYDQQAGDKSEDATKTDRDNHDQQSSITSPTIGIPSTPHSSENFDFNYYSEENQTDNKNKEDDLDLRNINENALLDEQLYGQSEDAVHLTNGIYCRRDVLTKALAGANAVSHFIRRIMHGVFRPSKVLKCTVSGQSWHAGGEEKLNEVMMPLHPKALNAIRDFAQAVAKKKGWPPIKRASKLRPIFSGRLQEIKKQVRDGKLKD